jgi:hypothetical protein
MRFDLSSPAQALRQRARRAYKQLRAPGNAPEAKVSITLPLRAAGRSTRYLAVVAIMKNEGRYLREWLEFQRLMGVDHVYLYDNGSTDESAEMLAPYVAEGFVTAIPWTTFDDEISPQRQAYAHAICNFGHDFRWMAFIDLDEFLFPVTAPDLATVLSTYEDCSCICVPWLMFGFCGHETPPQGLVIENYTCRAPFPPTTKIEKVLKWKSIVDPSAVESISGVHMFALSTGSTGGVDERRIPVSTKGTAVPPTSAILRINHYFTRSRQEFEAKINSVRFSTASTTHKAHPNSRQRLRYASKIDAQTIPDETILRFAPELRRRMTLDGRHSAGGAHGSTIVR